MRIIGSRKARKDPNRKWPTDNLRKAVEELSSEQDEDAMISMGLVGCHPIPEQEESVQIHDFAPTVHIVGLGLLRERRGDSWGGVLTRGLESDDGERRCIQYLYVYTQQMGVVSFFWNVFLPFLLGLWGLFVLQQLPSMLTPSSLLVLHPWFLLIIPFIPFCLPILAHYEEWMQGRPFGLRGSTIQPLLFFLIAISWIHPALPWGLILVSIIFGGYWLLEALNLRSTAHRMDYVPVLVFLRRVPAFHGKDDWIFHYAVWDRWHYNTGSSLNPLNMLESLRYTPGFEKPIDLTIDNPWHSMYLGEPRTQPGWKTYIQFVLSTLLVGIALFAINLIDWLDGLFPLLGTLSLSILCLLFVHSSIRIAQKPFLLIEESELDELYSDGAHLTIKKLNKLWNLAERQPSFFLLRWLEERRERKVKGRVRNWKRLFETGVENLKVQQQEAVRHLKDPDADAVTQTSYEYNLEIERLGMMITTFRRFEDSPEEFQQVNTKPRLVVVSKLQNPFEELPRFLDSFEDSPEHLYPLIRRLSETAARGEYEKLEEQISRIMGKKA